MILEVAHRTVLTYDRPIAETYMEVRLRPRDGGGQRCVSYELTVDPASEVRSYLDGFGNLAQYFNHVAPHEQVEVVARSVVETSAEQVHRDGGDFPADFLGFRPPVMDVAGVRTIARQITAGGGDLEGRLDRLSEHINRTFEYRPQTTDVYTAVDEVIRNHVGVCQDFAHLFISICRSMGVPCRYVSGYIHAGAGHRGAGASHAWAEAYIEGRGWIGYDPTNPVRAGDHHVRIAIGRDYQDVAPTRGTYVGTADEEMKVEVFTHPSQEPGARSTAGG